MLPDDGLPLPTSLNDSHLPWLFELISLCMRPDATRNHSESVLKTLSNVYGYCDLLMHIISRQVGRDGSMNGMK